MPNATEQQVLAALRTLGGVIPVGVLPIAEWGWGAETRKLAG